MFRNLFLIIIMLAAVSPAFALRANGNVGAASRVAVSDALKQAIAKQLAKRYPGARIQLTGAVKWIQGEPRTEMRHLNIVGETPRAEAEFTVENENREISRGIVSFAAWVPARVAVRKILPMEKLTPDLFVTQDVNIVAGQGREYRGQILSLETDVATLETRQTILDGQFLVSSAVLRVPDVRRGDLVRIHLISNGLTLSTTGIASEPAYVDGRVRVTASKTKRELVGKLMSGGLVEVTL